MPPQRDPSFKHEQRVERAHPSRICTYSSSSASCSSASATVCAIPLDLCVRAPAPLQKTSRQGQLTVKITLTLLGDAAAALLLILLKDLNLLKGLQDLAVDATASINVLRRARAAVLGTAMDLAETTNTDGLPKVNMAGNGSSTDVVPVDILRRHLLGNTGLHSINPTCTNPY